MAIAGKVAITLSTENNGQWSADVTYDRLVAVKHNNNLYISRKTVANVEPPNDEFWFLALEGFGGEDVETIIEDLNNIIDGDTQVGNAKTLDGHGAEYFAPKADLAKYLPLSGGTVKTSGNTTITNQSTDGDTILNRYEGTSGALGYFGFKGVNNPIYADKGGNPYTLLHTGNITDYVSTDSETGTFKLSLNGTAVTDNLSYCKVGKIVYVYGMVGLNKNIPAGSMLTGLPFSIKNTFSVIGGMAQKEGNITMESNMFTNLTFAQGTQISNKVELNAAGPFQLALIYVTN